MNLRLIDKWGPCPPDGYRYVFPEDGWVCHAMTYVDWIAAAKEHLAANDRPVPATLEADMQSQYCSTLPPGFCSYDDPDRPRPSVSLSWVDVARGVKVFSGWILGGAKYVPQAEADRRAEICTRCYLNVNVSGCSACQEIVKEMIGKVKTKHDHMLRACAVCKCLLPAKVHFPISTLDTENATVQQMYPDFCWLNKESENYRG